MRLLDEPGSGRLFVNDMQGPIYTISYDGEVELYLDITDPGWGVPVEFPGRERGVQSFALHPQFGLPATAGYGKLYVWMDTRDKAPEPDFVSGGGQDSHDTVLVEFTARDARAATYDGGPPRVLLRVEQPFRNHNGGYIAFNPLATPDEELNPRPRRSCRSVLTRCPRPRPLFCTFRGWRDVRDISQNRSKRRFNDRLANGLPWSRNDSARARPGRAGRS